MQESSQALSKREARRLLLSRQGLIRADQFGRGLNAVRRAIESISWVQIDTISVVERAHHHVLKTRVGNYEPAHLHRLQKERREIFEYWSHAAAYLPFRDYRYCLPLMAGSRLKHTPDKKLARLILDRIETEGPQQSKDFEAPPNHKAGGWWSWKPAKLTLEQLYLCGDLMVSHRDGFRKVYDLPERVIPAGVDSSMPDDDEWHDYLVRRMVSAWGVVTEYDIGYCKSAVRQLADKSIGPSLKASIDRLVDSGELIRLDVEGTTHYSSRAMLSALPIRLSRRRVRILSPFDNLVINRRKALEMFDFDYQIECYVPRSKRRYGYFCLPILYGDELIGRVDAKAERSSRTLIVRSLFLEDRIRLNDSIVDALQAGISRFREDNGCDLVRIESSTPKNLKRLLESGAR
ncbi:MAG: winged helix-turn-helix domain-containing protein [Gammaproteobacteria bacterium]